MEPTSLLIVTHRSQCASTFLPDVIYATSSAGSLVDGRVLLINAHMEEYKLAFFHPENGFFFLPYIGFILRGSAFALVLHQRRDLLSAEKKGL